MNFTNLTIHLVLSIVLIVGAYQFYFWCQRNALVEPREFNSFVDEMIPYRPEWVWIYSFLYYPAILYVNLVLDSSQQFTRIATSYLSLLALQMAFFLLFPVRTPLHWRTTSASGSPSERFLAFVHRFDSPANSFPSMHTSVAMLTACHIYPHTGAFAFLFPALIGLSCLFTKQHYLIDVPAGAAPGWFDYCLYLKIAAT